MEADLEGAVAEPLLLLSHSDATTPSTSMRLAIIGAGPAGLAAAHSLAPDLEVVVFEKSRGISGRAATRWRDSIDLEGEPFRWRYDHGAQYASPEPDSPSAALLRKVLGDSLVEMEGEVWPFDDDGTLRPDRARDGGLRWTTAEGISQIGRALVDATPGLDLRRQTRVVAIEPDGEGWAVVLEDESRERFDAVLVTAPAPQAAELLSGLEVASDVDVTYRSQFAVMWAFDHVVERPADVYALVNAAEHGGEDGGHDVAWLAVESDKPGRAPEGCTLLLAQMSERWTLDHYDDKKEDVVGEAARAVESLWGSLPEPLWTDTQRWRYSLPNGGLEVGALEDAAPGLFVAGDWTAGKGRVHLALEEGLKAAARIRATGRGEE